MGDTKYKHGDEVHVQRAGVFGTAWVKATYEQAISDYHTVKEFGGSYRDGVSIRPAAAAEKETAKDINWTAGGRWPSHLTEIRQKAQNPSHTTAEWLAEWSDPQGTIADLKRELVEAQLVIREQGEQIQAQSQRIAKVEGFVFNLRCDRAADADRLDALRADADRDKWMEEWTRLAEKYQALLTERDKWAETAKRQAFGMQDLIKERDAALAKVKELEAAMEEETAHSKEVEEIKQRVVFRLECKLEDAGNEIDTLRATIARVETLRDNEWHNATGDSHLSPIAREYSRFFSEQLTAALKGDK